MLPREFVFNRFADQIQPVHDEKEENRMRPTRVDTNSVSPNARKMIIERALRNGVAWEKPTVELISKLTKASKKKKFVKARLGTKAAKSHERLESVGDELEGEAVTMFRALSARYLYLSMDGPECAFFFLRQNFVDSSSVRPRRASTLLSELQDFLLACPSSYGIFHFKPQ